mmetsp:Transcript_52231/g.151781  ORF Transcript_52231/g.151781 Transcript_52231/m.151781 type:complete len:234 (+) Transcript_52231:801-1502(+)
MPEHCASSRRRTASFRTSSTRTTSSLASASAGALPPLICLNNGAEEPQEGVLTAAGGDLGDCGQPSLGPEPGGPSSTARHLKSGDSRTPVGLRPASPIGCPSKTSGSGTRAPRPAEERPAAQGDARGEGGPREKRCVACTGKVPLALITTRPPSSHETRRLKPPPALGSTSASGASAYMLLGALGTARSGGSMRDQGASHSTAPPAAASAQASATTGRSCGRRACSTAPDSPS